jgi:hypothetical protein
VKETGVPGENNISKSMNEFRNYRRTCIKNIIFIGLNYTENILHYMFEKETHLNKGLTIYAGN